MTHRDSEAEQDKQRAVKLSDCAGAWYEGGARLLGTVLVVVVFGAAVYWLLEVEILLMDRFEILPDVSLLVKALILVVLLVAILLGAFWIAGKLYWYVRGRKQKPADTLFDSVSRWLDNWFRRLDWCVNHGRWSDLDRGRWMMLPGHSARPTILAILMAGFLALGPRFPDFNEGGVTYGLFAAAVFLILSINRFLNPKRWHFLFHLAVLISLSLAVFVWPESAARRVVDADPYQHFLIPLFWLIATAILLAGTLGFVLFQKYAGRIAPSVSEGKIESCQTRPSRPLHVPGRNRSLGIDLKRFFRSLAKAPFFHLIEIAWWPALAVVFVADLEDMGRAAFFLGVAAWVFYALGEMHEELDSFLGILRRALFIGGQLLISIAVIGLAAGRLLDNGYIRTLIEGEGPFGGVWPFGEMNNWVLLYYLASAYTLFWYLEYWINRFSAERLLAIFASDGKSPLRAGPIGMCYRESAKAKDVKEAKDGNLIVHEAARYALVGDEESAGDGSCVKRIIGRVKLIREAIGDDSKINVSGRRRKKQLDFLLGREFKLVIVHRLRFYFTTIYLVLAAAAGYGAYWAYSLPQRAELRAELPGAKDERLFGLREHLFSEERRGQRPAILLAASGGGTRAAVYTYSVLRGLHDLGVVEDVVLASGVSGGSAALAYFAMHRDELLQAESGGKRPSRKAAECSANAEECAGWERFGAVMSAPFIQDALRGLTEGRMTWGCSGDKGAPREGMRLGVLLQESFDRWFALDAKHGPIYSDACAEPPPWDKPGSPVTRLGDQPNVGLLFNTALAGAFYRDRFVCPDGEDCADMPLSVAERLALDDERNIGTVAAGKGGRLVLTNLRVLRNPKDGSEGPFPDEADVLAATPGDFLTYKVINDPEIPLVSAAALSANFPPVFPNAAVDVSDEKGGQRRFWVTDGGATDNRGIISLLYALEGAIREQLECVAQSGAKDAETPGIESQKKQSPSCSKISDPVYPPIHIVIAEASGADPAYKQDRGISTALGGAERFASQMMVDKVKRLRDLYAHWKEKGAAIYIHKLAMPLTLRSAGGIGTHWMLPQNVTLRPPFGLADGCPEGQGSEDACWPKPLPPVERFRRLTEPGVDISGEQAKGLVEALHGFPWSADSICEVCASAEDEGERARCRENMPRIWQRWICEDPQDTPHSDIWYRFVEGMEDAYGVAVGHTYTAVACGTETELSCDDSRGAP